MVYSAGRLALAEHDPHLESSTPELDAFLDGDLDPDAEVPLSLGEVRIRLRAALDRPPAEVPPEEVPALILVCWRLARAIAVTLGMAAEDEALESACEGLRRDPWRGGVPFRATPMQRRLLRLGAQSRLHALSESGLSLLPPAHELSLPSWCEAADIVLADLGATSDPRSRAACEVLRDPARARLAPVSASGVMALEDLVCDEVGRLLVRSGELAAVAHLRTRYGLARREAMSTVRLARAQAVAVAGRSSVEEDRSVMVAQLKDYLARSRATLNMADELRALKELAKVQGLTRSDPEDRAMEFLGVVERVAGRQDALLEAASDLVGADPDEVRALLPPPREADAVIDYDRENTRHG